MSDSVNGLAYLATPYSKYPDGIEHAFRDAARLAARLMQSGIKVFSPIAHTHPLAIWGDIDPYDHEIWLPFDRLMMTVCETLIVAHMDSWEVSKGIQHEVQYFLTMGRPIFDLDPYTLKMTKRRAAT